MSQTPATESSSPSKINPVNQNKVIIAILVALTTSLLIIGGFGLYTIWDSLQPTSTLTVQGKASRRLSPDTARITFYVTESGTDLNVLNRNLDQKISRLEDYLKSKGIDSTDITVNKSSYPEYNSMPAPEPDPATPQRIRAEASFAIVFRDLPNRGDLPNTVLQEVVSLGVTRFDPYGFEFDNREEICRELQTEAISDGFVTAEKQMQALGGRRIIRRNLEGMSGCDQDYRVFPMYAEASMPAMSDPGSQNQTPPKLTTGEQELVSQVSIQLTYR